MFYRDLFGDSLFESKVEAIKCISSLLQVLLTEIGFELFYVNCTDNSKLKKMEVFELACMF